MWHSYLANIACKLSQDKDSTRKRFLRCGLGIHWYLYCINVIEEGENYYGTRKNPRNRIVRKLDRGIYTVIKYGEKTAAVGSRIASIRLNKNGVHVRTGIWEAQVDKLLLDNHVSHCQCVEIVAIIIYSNNSI